MRCFNRRLALSPAFGALASRDMNNNRTASINPPARSQARLVGRAEQLKTGATGALIGRATRAQSEGSASAINQVDIRVE